MHSVIRSNELEPSAGGTITWEGESYGSGVSFFLVINEPGAGPDLHLHPYSETWIVRSGRVRFTASGEELEAGPGDIVALDDPAETRDYWAIDPGTRIVCFGAAPGAAYAYGEWIAEEAEASQGPTA